MRSDGLMYSDRQATEMQRAAHDLAIKASERAKSAKSQASLSQAIADFVKATQAWQELQEQAERLRLPYAQRKMKGRIEQPTMTGPEAARARGKARHAKPALPTIAQPAEASTPNGTGSAPMTAGVQVTSSTPAEPATTPSGLPLPVPAQPDPAKA